MSQFLFTQHETCRTEFCYDTENCCFTRHCTVRIHPKAGVGNLFMLEGRINLAVIK
jgi:hypothetical protein